MADLKRTGRNNQKRGVSVFTSEIMATAVAQDDTLATLPAGSVVTNAYVVVTTVSGTTTDTVDIKVGSTVVGNECVVGVIGLGVGTPAPTYFGTGGDISVVSGADAPDTAGEYRVVVEYVELNKTTGEYTN
jgi:hypothetical protein